MIPYTVEVTRGWPATNPPTTAINTNPRPHHDFIITYLGRNQQEYLVRLPELLGMIFYCSKCGSLAHFNQWIKRSAWSSDSPISTIPQLQVLCTNPACKKTHVIIPDFLHPYKRYIGKEIESSIEQETADTSLDTQAEESTKKRWRRQFAKRLPEVLNTLIRLLIIEYENLLSLLECSGGLSRLRKILLLYPERESSTTMGRTNMELFLGGSRQFL